jgi:hypothetical protein
MPKLPSRDASRKIRRQVDLIDHGQQARERRTKAEIDRIRRAIYETLEADNPQTVRGLFYQLVSAGIVRKLEAEYKGTVIRLASEMRLAGVLPFEWLADNTRWMRKPRSYTGLQNALELTRDTYRRALWRDQRAYVEIWLEKDALAGVLIEETAPYDVPLMVSRGYSSLSFLHSAAETIKEQKAKEIFLYYFGDHDPSGKDIPRVIHKRLCELAPEWADSIHFEVVAVTEEQIIDWRLPTRPTKKTDTRSRNWTGGESVEVDAIPAKKLRQIARECIELHIDKRILRRTRAAEEAERKTLDEILANMNGGAS